jgi:hypothetical protein
MFSASLQRTIRRVAPLAAVALAAGLAGLSSPAHAAVTLDVGIGCEYLGSNSYLCTGTASGGVAPYHYTWTGTVRHSGTHLNPASAVCGQFNSVNLSVTDAVGDQGSDSLQWGSSCRQGPPPAPVR